MDDTPTETAELRPSQITIDIAPPISFGGGEYKQLTLREPTGNDMLTGEQQIRSDVNAWTVRNRQYHMIALCAGVPFPVVTKLPARTLNKAWAFILPFYDYGQKTGEN